MSKEILIVNPIEPELAKGQKWQPVLGPETQNLLSSLSLTPEARLNVSNGAVRILGLCAPPGLAGQSTGLVIGYVQSGKTVSFTAVAALARDNGFRIVIVLAGTTNELLDQSRRRLLKDLRVEREDTISPWIDLPNPSDAAEKIRKVLSAWDDGGTQPWVRKTILITVLKHHQRIADLAGVMSQLDLLKTPVLIIDDEGDQAGLNTLVRKGNESRTYAQLLALRRALPSHSYLQYTATPQAPLLINLVDLLSPDFAEVLQPGEGYVGGQDLFVHSSSYVRLIPVNEIPTPQNPLPEPPESLGDALKCFFVGVCAALTSVEPPKPRNRSMLVHPSRETARHADFREWIKQALNMWQSLLGKPDGDPDKTDLRESFRVAYDDLLVTCSGGLPPFEDVWRALASAIGSTMLEVVNIPHSSKNPIRWADHYSWILVGGQKLDRGFTVEGLTVTYMPRGAGQRNADTIQQRARFFGYKRSYLGFCRVFLEANVRDAFVAYVESEQDIRSQLIQHSKTGEPLSAWKRRFILSGGLRPTRASVIDVDYQSVPVKGWFWPAAPHFDSASIPDNQRVVQKFLNEVAFVDYDGVDKRPDSKRNRMVRGIPLRKVLEEFLVFLRFAEPQDSIDYAARLIAIQNALSESPVEKSSIFLMAAGEPRRRSLNDEGKIPELFQGRTPLNGPIAYPGDTHVRDENIVSIQIGFLDIMEGTRGSARDLHLGVPIIAIHIPLRLTTTVLDQPQGGI